MEAPPVSVVTTPAVTANGGAAEDPRPREEQEEQPADWSEGAGGRGHASGGERGNESGERRGPSCSASAAEPAYSAAMMIVSLITLFILGADAAEPTSLRLIRRAAPTHVERFKFGGTVPAGFHVTAEPRYAALGAGVAVFGVDARVEPLQSVDGKAAARALETRYISTYEKLFGVKPGDVDATGRGTPCPPSRG